MRIVPPLPIRKLWHVPCYCRKKTDNDDGDGYNDGADDGGDDDDDDDADDDENGFRKTQLRDYDIGGGPRGGNEGAGKWMVMRMMM